MLRETWLQLVADWKPVFAQARTAHRGVRQAVGSLVCLGRRTLSRVIWTNGGQPRSWSAEYFLHSRAAWDPQRLFAPLLKRAFAKRGCALPKPSTSAIRCRRPFTGT